MEIDQLALTHLDCILSVLPVVWTSTVAQSSSDICSSSVRKSLWLVLVSAIFQSTGCGERVPELYGTEWWQARMPCSVWKAKHWVSWSTCTDYTERHILLHERPWGSLFQIYYEGFTHLNLEIQNSTTCSISIQILMQWVYGIVRFLG